MSSETKLLAAIKRFLAETGMSQTTFGQESIGERGLVVRLEAGRSVTLKTADRIRAFMREWKPGKSGRRQSKGKRPGCPASAA